MVYEKLDFERGLDPKEAIGVGIKNLTIPQIDKIFKLENTYWSNDSTNRIEWAIRNKKYEFIPFLADNGGNLSKAWQRIQGDPTFGDKEKEMEKLELKKDLKNLKLYPR